MKNRHETPEQKLTRLNSGVNAVSARFEKNQDSLRFLLQQEMNQAQNPEISEAPTSSEEPRSGWLPGPLSYPWFLMFASVPKVIELFFHSI